MGMDVYGKKPKKKQGEYFRNNVWYWHPLWDYCCFVDDSLIEKVPYAHSNSGDGLGAVQSRKLGFKLLQTIRDGSAELYVKNYYDHVQSLEKEPCFCTKIQYISTDLHDPNESNPPNKDCKICQGSGLVDNFLNHYHITVDNIKLFAEFLLDCGGFSIC